MTEKEQPKRILSWIALNKLQKYWEWKLQKAKEKGEDTAIIEQRVKAIKEAKDKT